MKQKKVVAMLDDHQSHFLQDGYHDVTCSLMIGSDFTCNSLGIILVSYIQVKTKKEKKWRPCWRIIQIPPRWRCKIEIDSSTLQTLLWFLILNIIQRRWQPCWRITIPHIPPRWRMQNRNSTGSSGITYSTPDIAWVSYIQGNTPSTHEAIRTVYSPWSSSNIHRELCNIWIRKLGCNMKAIEDSINDDCDQMVMIITTYFLIISW